MAKKKKKLPSSTMLVDRESFLSAIHLARATLEAMSDEIEALRQATLMPTEQREILTQVTQMHMHNLTGVNHALGLCPVEPLDPKGEKGLALN